MQIVPVSAYFDMPETYNFTYVDGDKSYHFKTQEDLEHFVQNVLSKENTLRSVCLPDTPGYPYCNYNGGGRSVKRVLSTSYDRGVKIGEHSQYWQNASYYILSTNLKLNFNAVYEYRGLKISLKLDYSSGVGTVFSADSTKRSKLVARASFEIKRYIVDNYDSKGRYLGSYEYQEATKIDQYSAVEYQK